MSSCNIYIHYIVTILYIYSGYTIASEYYVSAIANGEPCPPIDLPCHNFSFYSADYELYFTNDTIFYFLKGTHTLQHQLKINGVSNLTLKGLGKIEEGFHETVMQTTSVIMCSNYSVGISFVQCTDLVFKSMTIANCEVITLAISNASNVTLNWVSIQNSSGIGLYLCDVFNVFIANSSFAQNQPSETCLNCLGQGGNAIIKYDDYYYDNDQPTNNKQYNVDIVQSNFTLGFNPKNCTLTERYTALRESGGGLTIFLSAQSYKMQFYIDSVILYNNTANFGANFNFAVFLGHHSLIINNAIITHGKTLTYECSFGGGMIISINNAVDNENEIIIENSTFSHNVAQQYGGGILISWFSGSGNIEFRNCIIVNNTGYIGSGLVIFGLDGFDTIITSSFHLTNVVFDSNKVSSKVNKLQAAVVLLNVYNVTFEQIEVKHHNTTGLLGYDSHFIFDKNCKFVNNSGILGGGIALYDSSHLLIKENTNISFINNHASKSGGGIYVSQLVVLNTPTNCFFQVIPYNANASLYFVNNTADISGDIMYGGNIDYCINKPDFDRIFHYPQQTGLSVVSSDPIKVCFCESDRQNCSIASINIMVMPGINVNISLATVGLRNGLTEGVIKLTISDSSSTLQTDNNRLNANCTDVTFTLRTSRSLNITKVYVTLESSVSELLSDPLAKVIEVTIESCPIGFPLVNDTCICSPELNSPSITCDINTQILTRDGDMWIGYKNDLDCLIVYPNCPFDYCNSSNISFNLGYPNKQCLLNRSGIVCGQCAEGLSLMLGSNQCGQCTNNHIALIIPFAVAGITLIAFVIVLNLTVSVGTINGLIFYANVVKIYEATFFPNGSIPILSQFISWLNLDLGIETCFFASMNSCSKAWLQFTFIGYVWFLLMLVIILSQYSSKVVRLVGRQAIPVLATTILLSYTKLIRTVFQILRYTNIQCSGENNVMLLRWYIDANVQYLRGYCHVSLFLFSLVVLILLIIPYTIYLLTIPLFEGPLSKYLCCCHKSTYMKAFFDAYGGPYKDKCRFWTGFLLLVRVVLALVMSIDTEASIQLDVLTSLLVLIILMYFFLRSVYRHVPLFCLELFFIINLLFLVHISLQTSENSKRQVSSILLMSISFVVFCGIIFYHVWDHLLKSHLQQPIGKVKKIFKHPLPSSSNNMEHPLIRPGSPSVECTTTSVSVVSVEMRRETLLFDESNKL